MLYGIYFGWLNPQDYTKKILKAKNDYILTIANRLNDPKTAQENMLDYWKVVFI